ncbi:MAG: DUF2934 domain-containing protein [Phycisphaerales bacterium]|nr:DUF2934 domain-containing protein [Phycisphaerales bacterium]
MSSQTSTPRVRSRTIAPTTGNGAKTSNRPTKRARTTAASPAVRATPGTTTPSTTDGASPEEIAREAYFIWLERGGNEVVNWLEAERRLTDRYGR